MNYRTVLPPLVATLFGLLAAKAVLADYDLPSKFSNIGGISNTRHNLTQSTMSGGGGSIMNAYRNDYGEVCVYCHTPHGANTIDNIPLWNRTTPSGSYTTYETRHSATLTQPVTPPGANSLACLSCHDGTLAVDSIVNMPGSGRYSSAQLTGQNNTFLNTWNNTSGADASVHIGLNAVDPSQGCLACHSPDAGIVGAGATDFTFFAIGTDLTNDHPIGVTLPEARIGVDFNGPTTRLPKLAFFDLNSDGRADTNEIRFYASGDGYEVECATCHDPHGVPVGAAGGALIPSFLRVDNTNASAVCFTCHNI